LNTGRRKRKPVKKERRGRYQIKRSDRFIIQRNVLNSQLTCACQHECQYRQFV